MSCIVLRLKPMGKLVNSKKNLSTRQIKVLHGLWTQTYGETSYFQKKSKYWTEPRSCMVLGLKPMEKLVTSKKNLSTR